MPSDLIRDCCGTLRSNRHSDECPRRALQRTMDANFVPESSQTPATSTLDSVTPRVQCTGCGGVEHPGQRCPRELSGREFSLTAPMARFTQAVGQLRGLMVLLEGGLDAPAAAAVHPKALHGALRWTVSALDALADLIPPLTPADGGAIAGSPPNVDSVPVVLVKGSFCDDCGPDGCGEPGC